MSIPINPVSPRVQYVASSSQVNFTVSFPFFANADLSVWLTPNGSSPDDTTDILIYSTDYTITGAGDEDGGVVTLNTGATAGDIITIVRTMTEERLSLYLTGGLLTAEALNDDFSMDVMMSQQNQMQTQTLTPHYQYTSAVAAPTDLILPQLGAGDCWVMNSDATAIEAVDFLTGGGDSGSVTAILPTTTNALTKFSNTGGTIQDSGIVESSAGVITGIVSINGDVWPPDSSVWVAKAVNTAMVATNNYYLTGGGTLQMTLPTTIAAGTILRVVGFGATGWTIIQSAGQQIYMGNQSTTLGAGGSLASTNAYDNVELLCVVANLTFVVLSGVGNITVV